MAQVPAVLRSSQGAPRTAFCLLSGVLTERSVHRPAGTPQPATAG
jgi:hypothetical protein